MARQNIDEEWKTDPRRDQLIDRLKDSRLADGARVALNWLILDHKGKPVPLKKFKFLKDYDVYIECGLAEVDGDVVKIAGADRYSEFFEKQYSNGSKGGRPKKPRKTKKTQINPTEPNGTQNNPNENLETQTNPENPSISFSSSSSSSVSSSSSEITVSSKLTKAGAFIVGYKSRFLARWGTKVNVEGKDAGIAKRVAERLTFDEIEVYLDALFSIPDAELVKKKHPLFLFETKLNEIGVYAQSGEFHTQRQAMQADDAVAMNDQLKRIREGKL